MWESQMSDVHDGMVCLNYDKNLWIFLSIILNVLEGKSSKINEKSDLQKIVETPLKTSGVSIKKNEIEILMNHG